jgi:hypothetical protein
MAALIIIEIPMIKAAKTIANATLLFFEIWFQVFSGVNFSMIKYVIKRMTIPIIEKIIEAKMGLIVINSIVF